MHEEGGREGNGERRDCGFIAKLRDYFMLGFLSSFT
jgi:hypothetical protein